MIRWRVDALPRGVRTTYYMCSILAVPNNTPNQKDKKRGGGGGKQIRDGLIVIHVITSFFLLPRVLSERGTQSMDLQS